MLDTAIASAQRLQLPQASFQNADLVLPLIFHVLLLLPFAATPMHVTRPRFDFRTSPLHCFLPFTSFSAPLHRLLHFCIVFRPLHRFPCLYIVFRAHVGFISCMSLALPGFPRSFVL